MGKITGHLLSVNGSCGNGQDSSLLRKKSCKDDGDVEIGLVTLFASLQHAPRDMPSLGIHKAKGGEADQETPGAKTWRQVWRWLALLGDSWRNWLMTEMSGEPLLATYTQSGATGPERQSDIILWLVIPPFQLKFQMHDHLQQKSYIIICTYFPRANTKK